GPSVPIDNDCHLCVRREGKDHQNSESCRTHQDHSLPVEPRPLEYIRASVSVRLENLVTHSPRSPRLFLLLAPLTMVGAAQTPAPKVPGKTPTAIKAPDLAKSPTLYVVGYAHLDTQWRWEYPLTIGEYLPKTLRNNFDLFEKYPHYIFNFSGANRYRFFKE